jgi:Type VI secretion system/phage-baseplate injector OB domain
VPDLYFAKYTGIVRDNRDADSLGQIKVSVPSIFPPEELVEARCALPYGIFFVPEPQQKVWIEFEGGDSGLPIWTGIQYVPGEWPEEATVDPPHRRVIKSVSGQLIILHDHADERGIEISSNARVLIKSLGTIELDAPNVIIQGRVVSPAPRPI